MFTDLWHNLITNTPTLMEPFKNVCPQIVFKRDNTVANYLIRAKFRSEIPNDSRVNRILECNDDSDIINILAELHAENNSVMPCNTLRCKLCSNFKTSSSFTSSVTKKTYNITYSMSCYTSNVIYLVTCAICNMQYVGETGRPLRDRFNNHRSDIKLKKDTAIAIHFNNILHKYKHIQITPIEIINDPSERKNKEHYWIKELKTTYPLGINHYPI